MFFPSLPPHQRQYGHRIYIFMNLQVITYSSLLSFHETSRRILRYGNSFLPTFPEVLLAHASQMTGQLCEVCTSHANTDKLRGSIKCCARDNYVRIFSFTLLNNLDLWLINYYSSQLRFAHQRAVSVWPLICSVQVSMMFFLR